MRLSNDLDVYPLGLLPTTASVDMAGRLLVGGCALERIAEVFGTPAFVVDEISLRTTANLYREAFSSWHADSRVCFATKAFPCTPVLQLLSETGVGFDVAGRGELALALAAGVDPAEIVVHGNAKTDGDIGGALEARAGLIVVDGPDDLARLERLGAAHQPVLLRVNPGVHVDTHEALATGHSGSKFGVSLDAAPDLLRALERSPATELVGVHMHLGSQLTQLGAFEEAVKRLATLGRFDVYDLGGGLGVRYRTSDHAPSIDEYAARLVGLVHAHLGRNVQLLVEPGRSLVARSALTLYTVVTVKRDGATTFVAVDGGMADNLEPMMYDTRFEPIALSAHGPVETCELVGRQCETGDVLVHDARLPQQLPGDLVVLPVTGGYCYSLLSNYNGALRPPVVFCASGRATLRVRRETYSDLLARDVMDPKPVVLDEQATELEESNT